MAGNWGGWRQAIRTRCIARTAEARTRAVRSAADLLSVSRQLSDFFPIGVNVATAVSSDGIISAGVTRV